MDVANPLVDKEMASDITIVCLLSIPPLEKMSLPKRKNRISQLIWTPPIRMNYAWKIEKDVDKSRIRDFLSCNRLYFLYYLSRISKGKVVLGMSAVTTDPAQQLNFHHRHTFKNNGCTGNPDIPFHYDGLRLRRLRGCLFCGFT